MSWICTKCGGAEVDQLESRPSIDDRYAVGYCSCTPPPSPRKDRFGHYQQPEQQTVQLIRADLWDPAMLAERARVKREADLLKRSLDGSKHLSPADVEEAIAIRKRYEAEAEARRAAGS